VTIRTVDIVPWAIPLREPLVTARGIIRERRGFLVVVENDAGRRGLGEAAPHPDAPDTALAVTRSALGAVAPSLPGVDPTTLLGVVLTQDLPAASGLDMALHDLVARTRGCPVSALLGGAHRARVPASALGLAASIGFTCAKVKIGPDPYDAVARVASARAAEPVLALRADANGCWDVATARRVARALRRFDLEWLEQPIAPGDVAGLAQVRAEGVPIAADESITGAAAVDALADAVDAVVIKLVQVGGLAAAVRTAQRASHHRLGVTVTTSIDTSLATAAALHLAASLPAPLRACGLATTGLLAGDLVDSGLIDGPWMAPPPGPGLGVTIDAALLARWRVRDAA
jgi:L-alanine-DL-glutamate epimerase-like enolase superfamily enzyme